MTPRQTNRDRKFVRIMSVRILTTRRYQMEGGRNGVLPSPLRARRSGLARMDPSKKPQPARGTLVWREGLVGRVGRRAALARRTS